MPIVEIKPDVYWIGVNDRMTDLFESLWPITVECVAYNAYLINDEKKAIIDSVNSFKTHEASHGILFSGDGFGGFGAHRGRIFDDECEDIDHYIKETPVTSPILWRTSAPCS